MTGVPAPEAPIRVLFIGGMGRSGSTLLDRMLGSAPGAVSVGEVRKFWRRGVVANELCGCGEPIRNCPFWIAVANDAFGGFEFTGIEEITAAEDRLLIPLRRGVQFKFPGLLRGAARADFERMATARLALMRSITRVSGATLIIDSSKGPLYGAALARTPGLDLRPLHLVRDSRAVAYSWSKVKAVPRVIGQADYMPRLAPRVAALQWFTKNLQMEFSMAFGGGKRLHYERFVERPEYWVRRVLRFAGQKILF